MPCAFNFDFFKPTPTPTTGRISISSTRLVSCVKAQGWSMPFGTLDTEYYTTTPEQWAEILQKVVISELYVDETRDCDWYALDAMVIVQGKYNLNTFGYCQGNTPQGYHAWNVLLTSDCDWWCFEPQSGYGYGLFPLGQNGYRPDKILI